MLCGGYFACFSLRFYLHLTRYDLILGNRRLGAEESNRLRQGQYFGTCR